MTSLLARVGVVFCVVLTLGVCLRWLFHDALPGQNHWATLNAAQPDPERTFPSDEFIGSGPVAEAGRRLMPSHATYRVVVGDRYQNTAWGFAAPHFLEGYLFPRLHVDAPTSPWIFCLGCDVPSLGAGFKALAKAPNGVVFGRVSG